MTAMLEVHLTIENSGLIDALVKHHQLVSLIKKNRQLGDLINKNTTRMEDNRIKPCVLLDIVQSGQTWANGCMRAELLLTIKTDKANVEHVIKSARHDIAALGMHITRTKIESQLAGAGDPLYYEAHIDTMIPAVIGDKKNISAFPAVWMENLPLAHYSLNFTKDRPVWIASFRHLWTEFRKPAVMDDEPELFKDSDAAITAGIHDKVRRYVARLNLWRTDTGIDGEPVKIQIEKVIFDDNPAHDDAWALHGYGA
jgi:hypothetical protein